MDGRSGRYCIAWICFSISLFARCDIAIEMLNIVIIMLEEMLMMNSANRVIYSTNLLLRHNINRVIFHAF